MQRKPLPSARVSMTNTPVEQALAANLVGDMDLLRLKATARLLARGLAPEIQWWDLLQEAFARVLNGSRRRPPDVPIDAFMTGVMRSIRAECWRRRWRAGARNAEAHQMLEALDPAPDPERALVAQQEIEALAALFADDPVALQILTGIGDGLSADEIREEYGLTKKSYDTARKRMRRVLLRDGIRWKGP
jgi:DNA-directed RNA polymerase specialized sigma24 family protein